MAAPMYNVYAERLFTLYTGNLVSDTLCAKMRSIQSELSTLSPASVTPARELVATAVVNTLMWLKRSC
eukprot:5550-Heterococcus_DN1.PRE.13